MAHLLGAEALHLEFPTKVVFDSVSLGVDEGDRIGIVGRNGDGKSSLLAMLAGRIEPNAGRVTLRGGVRVGVLDQGDTLDDSLTIREAVVGDTPDHEWAGDARVRDVHRRAAHRPRLGRLGGAAVRRAAPSRRSRAAAGRRLGRPGARRADQPSRRRRHRLARGAPEARWSRASGALLVVTHDRWFLDEVCTATWEVHDGLVEPFEGGYAAYILQRVERDRQSATIEARRQNLARKELAWLRRGAPARTSKPKFRIDAANELIADVPEIRDKIALQSLAVSRLGKDVVDLLDVSVTYDPDPSRPSSATSSGASRRASAPASSGVNGAGKSTLLGLISGTVEPTSGRVKRGKTVQVATLTQRIDNLEPHLDEPVRVVIAGLRTSYVFGSGSKAQELTPGQLLERLGFQSAQLSTPVKDLSGGQQRRLQLLLILLEQPNVLILDEPTNDLDTDMLAALEDLLDSWPGTLIVVSHDRYFIERVTDQQYAIFDGHLRHLPGGLEEYLRVRTAQQSKADAAPPRPSALRPRHPPPPPRCCRGPSAAPPRRSCRRSTGGSGDCSRSSTRSTSSSPTATTTTPSWSPCRSAAGQRAPR